jgi:hypothetical protein
VTLEGRLAGNRAERKSKFLLIYRLYLLPFTKITGKFKATFAFLMGENKSRQSKAHKLPLLQLCYLPGSTPGDEP